MLNSTNENSSLLSHSSLLKVYFTPHSDDLPSQLILIIRQRRCTHILSRDSFSLSLKPILSQPILFVQRLLNALLPLLLILTEKCSHLELSQLPGGMWPMLSGVWNINTFGIELTARSQTSRLESRHSNHSVRVQCMHRSASP